MLAEVSRTQARSTTVDRVLRRARVIPTDRPVAEHAGRLLPLGLDSRDTIDAFVVATAALILTAMPATRND